MLFSRDYLYALVTYDTKGPLAAFCRGVLFLLSLLYGLAVSIIAGLYRIRPARINCKVISVGNITLGGTGKTSFVEYLAAKLARAGNKVAVLSRGYKRDARLSGSRGIGDEPAMLQRKLSNVPVLVDRDRLRSAQRAIEEYAADTLILDDGMQQWRISKDLEIVTIDACRPFGNSRLLPAGFLREPLRALKRADIFVLTQIQPALDVSGLEARLKKINPRALIVEARRSFDYFRNLGNPDETPGPESFRGKSVLAFSGIGNPHSFEEMVRSLGINIAEALRFPDHYDYKQADLDALIKRSSDKGLSALITTEKDAVKISRLKLNHPGIFSLSIKMIITKNEAEFDRRLFKLYSF